MPKRDANRDNDLRRLRRRDLLQLLEELSRENDRLRSELEQSRAELATREAVLSRCGSIAEASLALSGIFEAADEAARVYVDSCKQAADEGVLVPERRESGVRALIFPEGKRGKHTKKRKGKGKK